MDRTQKILNRVRRHGQGLEIGPSHSPIAPKAEGWNVHVVDHASAAELRQKYEGHGVDLARIEEVDYTWRGEALDSCLPSGVRYDFIIASHVVEHIPDLVAFFQACSRLLRPDGVLTLAIPDKRFCFDLFRWPSSTGDLLQAHLEKRSVHTLGQVFDEWSLGCTMDGDIAWTHRDHGLLALRPFSAARSMYEKYQPSGSYVDVHGWRFTPSSFALVMLDLRLLGLVDLSEVESFDTVGSEFFVTLGKRETGAGAPDELDIDRTRLHLCQQMLAELAMSTPDRIAFDDDLYLAANADVANAGMDPWNHYVVTGKAENRPLRPTPSAPGNDPATTPQTQDETIARSRAAKLSGDECLDQGKLEEAARFFREATRLNPRYAEAHTNLGFVLREQGLLQEAREELVRAISINPNLAQAQYNLGAISLAEGAPERGIARFSRALEIAPDLDLAARDLAYALAQCGKSERAQAVLLEAIDRNPEFPDFYFYLGNLNLKRGDKDAAAKCYRRAIELQPDHRESHNNLAVLHQEKCEWEAALQHFKIASEDPSYIDPQIYVSVIALMLGDYQTGLEYREKRIAARHTRDFAFIERIVRRMGAVPFWQGEPARDRTLLVWTEQGLGDSVMTFRYLPLLRERVARLIVYCEPHLTRLLQNVSGVDQVISKSGDPTSAGPFDLHCSLLSLPYLFGTRLHSIPSRVPYLKVPGSIAQKWKERVAASRGLNVGLAWAGNRENRNDALRSLSTDQMEPLMKCPGVRFISLQKEGTGERARPGLKVEDWMNECSDLLDTAALIEQLDLVVCVDTVIAHLAGALGKPVWLLLRYESEWMWMLDRADSPWYPTLRIFRQTTPRDWDGVMQRVAGALADWASGADRTSGAVSRS